MTKAADLKRLHYELGQEIKRLQQMRASVAAMLPDEGPARRVDHLKGPDGKIYPIKHRNRRSKP